MSFIINPYQFSSTVQLLNEQFEDPLTGWVSTVGGAARAWLPTYTPALVGNQSCQIENTGSNYTNAYKNFTPSGKVYCRFQIRHKRVCAIHSNLVSFQTQAAVTVATFQLSTNSSRWRINAAGGTTASASQTPLQETNYWAFLEYEKGTGGATAICRAGFSETQFRPTSWTGLNAICSDGTTTNDAGRIVFGSPSSFTSYDVIVDNIQIQTTPFPTA
jgi:hypothetical protein